MAQLTGTTDTFDLIGLAEDVENTIYNISPMETVLFTTAKRVKVQATRHQWQTDSLASAANNAAIQGDDSTYATATPTTMLSNYTQISKKTVMVTGTADAVRKYGRAEEFAYQIAKKGRELKRAAGTSSAAAGSAGLESMIVNYALPTTSSAGTSSGYVSGVWTAPTDGTATGAGSTLTEAYLRTALQAAWTDGGDPSLILCGAFQKNIMAGFAGANKFAGVYNPSQGRSQGMVIGGIDLYISDFGEHKIRLSRYVRTRTVLCLDPEYVGIGFLRPIKFEERAKTGDATKGEILCEWTLVVGNPDAHAKVPDLATS